MMKIFYIFLISGFLLFYCKNVYSGKTDSRDDTLFFFFHVNGSNLYQA